MGEGNGNPLQCYCLENPRDEGAWWAAVCGVAQSQTRLKRLSSSSIPWYGQTSDCLTIHPLKDIWVVPNLWLLQLKLLWTFMHSYFVNLSFHFSGMNAWKYICWLLYVWFFFICLIFKETIKLFQSRCTIFPPAMCGDPFLHILTLIWYHHCFSFFFF